ncbi:MAG TPA: hypothetical protein VK530_09550 [Candidatus Acidoferrum sp.]|nr:hypothetical protein [Candidatus Acidoferrum sp.]
MSARTLERWCDEWASQEFSNGARAERVSKPAVSAISKSAERANEQHSWTAALRVIGSTRDEKVQVIQICPKVSDE